MRDWLRAHSTIYRHFDPAPVVPTYPCGFCQTPFATSTDRHVIGECFHGQWAFWKLCDGTEQPK